MERIKSECDKRRTEENPHPALSQGERGDSKRQTANGGLVLFPKVHQGLELGAGGVAEPGGGSDGNFLRPCTCRRGSFFIHDQSARNRRRRGCREWMIRVWGLVGIRRHERKRHDSRGESGSREGAGEP